MPICLASLPILPGSAAGAAALKYFDVQLCSWTVCRIVFLEFPYVDKCANAHSVYNLQNLTCNGNGHAKPLAAELKKLPSVVSLFVENKTLSAFRPCLKSWSDDSMREV